MSGRGRDVGTAISRTGGTRPERFPLSEADGDGANELCVGDFGYDHSGLTCSECGSDLTSDGLCGSRSPRCPFASRFQDEVVPAAVWREVRQVVANTRSRRAYRYATRGYLRVLGSPHRVAFADEYEASAAGYEVHDD